MKHPLSFASLSQRFYLFNELMNTKMNDQSDSLIVIYVITRINNALLTKDPFDEFFCIFALGILFFFTEYLKVS